MMGCEPERSVDPAAGGIAGYELRVSPLKSESSTSTQYPIPSTQYPGRHV